MFTLLFDTAFRLISFQYARGLTTIAARQASAKIRNLIYHYTFRSLFFHVLPSADRLAVFSNRWNQGFTSTCRQIHRESLSLFFS
jgi:hypothetical protein